MFTASVLLLCVAMIALFGAVILLPMYLQEIRGLSSLETGLVLLPGGLAMGLLGPLIGRLFDRSGPRPLTVTGSVLLVAVPAGSSPCWTPVTAGVAADRPACGLSLGLACCSPPPSPPG